MSVTKITSAGRTDSLSAAADGGSDQQRDDVPISDHIIHADTAMKVSAGYIAPIAYSLAKLTSVTGLGRTFLFSEIKAGRLSARKFGRRTLVLHEDLITYFKGQRRR